MAKFFTPSRLSENIRETPEGYLLCLNVPIARTGWQEYGPGETPLEVGDDGVVNIYRDAKDVFRPQTLASFQGKSVTIKHPNDFVDPKNWKMLTHGIIQNVRKASEKDEDGEQQMIADLLITDDFCIGLVNNGLRKLSCGYDAEYEQTGDGEGRQFNIVGNHVALVEQGRAGTTYAIKDHKGRTEQMTLKELAEKIKNLSKTVDEAMVAQTKDEDNKSKKAKAKDATPEQVCYDDIMEAMSGLSKKMDDMMKGKDGKEVHIDDESEEKEKPNKKAKEEKESEDEEESSSENSRLDKLEAAVAKILETLGNKGAEDEEGEESEEDMSGDEDYEESEDEDESEAEDEEGEEGEESQKKSTGDAARIEILTPGKKFKGKDARSQCLKTFAKTEDGAEILKRLGMKKPVFDSKTNFDMIFMAAHALMKTKRGVGLKETKDGRKWKAEDVDNTASEPMTAEKLNEINAKHFGAAN